MNSPETQTSAAQEAAPVRVGKNTVIQRPYNGTVPKVKKGTQYEIVSISSTALEQAETQITAAQAQAESGKSFKKSLTSFYREAMGNLFGGRAVQVENVRFEDQPYDVTLNTKVISKVISDPHLTAEKLAVFRHIENVVRNAEYLGSGQYTAHGAKTKPATRYDYFETQAIIGGQEYTVSFDVEVYPDRNNYRTHRVVNNLELSPAADGTNNTKKERPPVSAVQTAYSGADARTIQAAAERGFVPYNSIAQTGENATGFSGPAAERTSDVSAVPSALNPAPRLYTRAEVQGMSAGEVRENYDAIRESMEMWDENGELQGGTQSRMVDRQAPGEDNETTSGNERLYTRAEVQGMSEEEQLANVDAIRESMGLWDAEGKLSKESEITIEEVRDDFEQIKHIKNLENFVEDPLLLKDVSPETLYCFLEKQGYTILPLAQSKTLTGIHYKDGGGFKVNWGGDRILQYHPATGSHHNGAYYKISSGKTGKVRIDLHGNKI